MDRIKTTDLTDTAEIKAEVQFTIALAKEIYQGQRWPIENLQNEVEILKRGMIDDPRIDQWSEDMYSELTPVLEVLGKRMKHLDINTGTGVGGVGIWMSEIAALEDRWEGKLNEVAARNNGMDVFAGGRWFWSHV